MDKIKSDGFPDRGNPIVLYEMSLKYIQDSDEGDELQEIEISTVDNAGDKYYVIKTERWALDDRDWETI